MFALFQNISFMYDGAIKPQKVRSIEYFPEIRSCTLWFIKILLTSNCSQPVSDPLQEKKKVLHCLFCQDDDCGVPLLEIYRQQASV